MDLTHFIAPARFEKPEFTIRSYLPGDGPLLNEAVNDSYEHLKTFMVWAKPEQSVAESEQLVRRFRADYLVNKDFVLGIFSPNKQQLLGGTGFHPREGGLQNRSAEIGIWIHSVAAHQGLGTQVARALLEWGFNAWPWERLAWRCDGRNAASRRVAEKVGFQFEGTLRAYHRLENGDRADMHCFSILRDDR